MAMQRTSVLAALLGGVLLIAGTGAALADDDDWHSEAERPAAPQQQIKDKAAVQAIAAAKPERERIYAPSSTLTAVRTEHPIASAYQTATADKPQR